MNWHNLNVTSVILSTVGGLGKFFICLLKCCWSNCPLSHHAHYAKPADIQWEQGSTVQLLYSHMRLTILLCDLDFQFKNLALIADIFFIAPTFFNLKNLKYFGHKADLHLGYSCRTTCRPTYRWISFCQLFSRDVFLHSKNVGKCAG